MRVRITLLVTAIALSLAACSSSGGSSDSNASGAEPSPVVNSSAGTTAAGVDPYCAKVADWSQKFTSLQSDVASGDPDKLKTAFAGAVAYFNGLKDGAPAELTDAVNTISSALSEAATQFSGDTPDISALGSLQTRRPPAITTFTQWVATNCAAS